MSLSDTPSDFTPAGLQVYFGKFPYLSQTTNATAVRAGQYRIIHDWNWLAETFFNGRRYIVRVNQPSNSTAVMSDGTIYINTTHRVKALAVDTDGTGYIYYSNTESVRVVKAPNGVNTDYFGMRVDVVHDAPKHDTTIWAQTPRKLAVIWGLFGHETSNIPKVYLFIRNLLDKHQSSSAYYTYTSPTGETKRVRCGDNGEALRCQDLYSELYINCRKSIPDPGLAYCHSLGNENMTQCSNYCATNVPGYYM